MFGKRFDSSKYSKQILKGIIWRGYFDDKKISFKDFNREERENFDLASYACYKDPKNFKEIGILKNSPILIADVIHNYCSGYPSHVEPLTREFLNYVDNVFLKKHNLLDCPIDEDFVQKLDNLKIEVLCESDNFKKYFLKDFRNNCVKISYAYDGFDVTDEFNGFRHDIELINEVLKKEPEGICNNLEIMRALVNEDFRTVKYAKLDDNSQLYQIVENILDKELSKPGENWGWSPAAKLRANEDFNTKRIISQFVLENQDMFSDDFLREHIKYFDVGVFKHKDNPELDYACMKYKLSNEVIYDNLKGKEDYTYWQRLPETEKIFDRLGLDKTLDNSDFNFLDYYKIVSLNNQFHKIEKQYNDFRELYLEGTALDKEQEDKFIEKLNGYKEEILSLMKSQEELIIKTNDSQSLIVPSIKMDNSENKDFPAFSSVTRAENLYETLELLKQEQQLDTFKRLKQLTDSLGKEFFSDNAKVYFSGRIVNNEKGVEFENIRILEADMDSSAMFGFKNFREVNFNLKSRTVEIIDERTDTKETLKESEILEKKNLRKSLQNGLEV